MRRVKTVFGGYPPVTFDLVTDHRVGHEVIVPEAGLRILLEVQRLTVADPDEDDLMPFERGVRVQAHLAEQGTVRLTEDFDQPAVAPIIGKAVKPAREGVLGVTLRAHG